MTRARNPDWNQIDLPLDGASGPEGAWLALLKAVRAEIDRRGLKEVAFELDMQPSQLSHCLNERERHNLPMRALPYLVMHADNDALPVLIASWRALKCEPRAPLTPEEEVARHRQFLATLPESLRRAAAASIYGDDETARFRKR